MVRYIVSIRHFLTLYSVNKTLFDAMRSAFPVNSEHLSFGQDAAASGAGTRAQAAFVTRRGPRCVDAVVQRFLLTLYSVKKCLIDTI